MPSIHDTAYPRLKSSWSEKDLNATLTPTAEEIELAHSSNQATALRITFLLLFKTFQRFGCFLLLHKVPRQIAEHISFSSHLLKITGGKTAMNQNTIEHFSPRALLCALAPKILSLKLFETISEHLFIKMIEKQMLH